jgi:hypothetical protein
MPLEWPRDLAFSLILPLQALAWSLLLRRWASNRQIELGPELALASGFAGALAFTQAIGMALGFLGLLKATLAGGLLVAGLVGPLVLGRGELRRATKGAAGLLPSLALLIPLLLMATFPPWDRDEMVYHLALPRAFAVAGGYVRPDDNLFASFPLGWESIQAVWHTLGRSAGEAPFNPRLLGAWTAWGAALATSALAREAGAGKLSWLGGALLLLTPTFVEFGSSAYVEPYLMLGATLALIGALRVVRGEAFLWMAVGGAGLAVSTKYSGLGAAAIVALLLAVGPGDAIKRRQRVLFFIAGCALVGSPFYLRNMIERGNPFFPMAYGLLGGEGWDDLRAALYWETLRGYGAGDDILDALTAPLRVFFTRDMGKGFEGSVGPLPLLGALAAFKIAGERRTEARLVLGFAGLYGLFWACTVVQARFLLVAVGPLLALLAVGVGALPQGRAAAVALLVGALAWGAGPIAHLWGRQPTASWLAGQPRDAALTQVLKESYTPLRELEEFVPEGQRVWLVWMRGYTYYLRRPYRLDSVYEEWRLATLLEGCDDAAQVAPKLRAEGFSFLLINEQFFLKNGSADTRPGRTTALRARFEEAVARGDLRKVRAWGKITLYEVGGAP